MEKKIVYRYPFWQKYPKFLMESVLMLNFLLLVFLGIAVMISALAAAVYKIFSLSDPVADKFISSLDGSHYMGGIVAVVLGFLLLKDIVRKFRDWILPLEVVKGKITSVREEYTADSESGTDHWFVYIGDRCWEIPDRVSGRISKGQTVEIHATAYYKEVRSIFRIK